MAERSEHITAFHETVALLHAAAAAHAHAIEAHRGTRAGDAAVERLDNTLDRLARLHGTGTVENLATTALFETAIRNELHLAHDSAPLDPAAAGAQLARAQALIDAARRGFRLHVRMPTPAPMRRGAYIEPFRPDVELSLRRRREPYLRWRNGVVVVLTDREAAELRAAGDEVDVLFLDSDELLDLAAGEDRAALEAELERRLSAARAAPDRIGDARERHRERALLRQSALLRNLRGRLAGDHPAAHAATHPIVADNRAQLEAALVRTPPSTEVRADPLQASLDHEHRIDALIGRLAAEHDDPAGLRGRFRAAPGATADRAQDPQGRGSNP